MPTADFEADQPYCGNCGYQLSGAFDASKCPECGRPLVEVLMRGGRWGKRFRSKATLFGLPVVDVAYGPKPGETMGRPRGIIALGDAPMGVLAIGGMARGVVAIGGVAIGVVAFGGVSLSLLAAMGGIAVGALSYGGLAIGLLASGGLALGYVATGGLAVGVYAIGGATIGMYTAGGSGNSAEAMDMLKRCSWFCGTSNVSVIVRPPLVVIGMILVGSAFAGLLAVLGALRSRDREQGQKTFGP